MRSIDFKLEAGDANCGTVYLPEAVTGVLPVVVYCHGWGASRKLTPVTSSLSRLLETRPAALVAFDFFGCGDTGGNYSLMTYGRWRANLADVFDWIVRQPWADPARVGCFAISSGTTAALRFAATSSLPAFVISVATCAGTHIHMPNPPGRILVNHINELAAGRTAELFGTQFGLEFFRDFLNEAPVYNLRSINCPVFFLQGARDNPWRRADAWLGHQLLKEKGAKYLEVEDGDHGLDSAPDTAAREAFAWLQQIDFSAGPKGGGLT
jgi:pimeloyl-ACP methyl ester carboxylesterase